MRFKLDYKDYEDGSSTNKSIGLLETFLNFYLVETFHGWSYECILITFKNKAPKNKKNTAKKYLDQFAKAEVNGVFKTNSSNNIPDLHEGFELTRQAVRLVDQISLKEKDFKAQTLLNELEELQSKLPQTEEELFTLYRNKQVMEDGLQIKRVNGYLKASKEYPQQLRIKLIGVRTYPHFGKAVKVPHIYIYILKFSARCFVTKIF